MQAPHAVNKKSGRFSRCEEGHIGKVQGTARSMVARACPACAARHKWGKSSGSARNRFVVLLGYERTDDYLAEAETFTGQRAGDKRKAHSDACWENIRVDVDGGITRRCDLSVFGD